MKRRSFIKTVGLAAAAGIGGRCGLHAESTDGGKRPNVIIINIDNHSKTMLGYYGNTFIETPNINSLADKGVRFENYRCASRCAPSRSALMSGRYHLRSGSIGTGDGRKTANNNSPSMGDLFKKAGYRTGLFGKWHLGANYPFRPEDRGFEESISYINSQTTNHVQGPGGKRAARHKFRHNGVWEPFDGYRTDVWFRELKRFIKEKPDKPFFAYLATWSTHGPNCGPLHLSEKYQQKIKNYKHDIEDDKLSNAYEIAAEIDCIDTNIGKLLDFLKEKGLRENTIVVYASDGSGASAPDCFYKPKFDSGSGTPLLMSWPCGGHSNVSVKELVANFDVLPTLMDMCGIEQTTDLKFDGQSAFGLFDKKGKPWKKRFYVSDHQSKSGDSEVIIRPLDSTTVVTPEGISVSWQKGKARRGKDACQEHVDIAQAHYDEWFKNVMQDFRPHQYAIVGTEHENPSWVKSSYTISDGSGGKGKKIYIPVEFAIAGQYMFSSIEDFPGRATYSRNGSPSATNIKTSDKKQKVKLIIGDQVHEGEFPMTLEMKPGKHLIFVDTGKGKGSGSIKIEKM